MSDFHHLSKKTPLTLRRTFSESDLHKVKLTIELQGNSTAKYQVTQLSLVNTEQALIALTDFEDIATRHNFDADDKFLYFPDILDTSARQDWAAIVEDVQNKTDATFKASTQELVYILFDRNSFRYFKDYLQRVKKPKDMSTRALASRFRVLINYSSSMPHSSAISLEERKTMFLQMFPLDQQTQFQRAFPVLDDIPLSRMIDFFSTFDDLHKDSSSYSTHTTGSSSSGSSSKRPYNGNNKNPKSPKHKKQSKNMCRHHEYLGHRNHTWDKCIFNPRSSNYDPEKAARSTRQNMQQRKSPALPGSGPTRSIPSASHYHQHGAQGSPSQCPAFHQYHQQFPPAQPPLHDDERGTQTR